MFTWEVSLKKIISVLFSFLFIIQVPTEAKAYNACLELFHLASEGGLRANFANDNLSPQLALETQMSQWNSLLGDLRTDTVQLVLEPTSFLESYFRGPSNIIHLGSLSVGSGNKAVVVALAHEFGHSIFQQNFYLFSDQQPIFFRDLAAEAKKNSLELADNSEFHRLAALEKKVLASIKIASQANLPDQSARLEAYLSAVQEKIAKLQQPLLIYSQMRALVTAYDELFADSLPALFWRDPHVMTEALDSSKDDELTKLNIEMASRGHNTDAPAARDFVITGFKNWKHELNDQYTSLDPSRGVLWALYMKNLPQSEIPLFLKTFINATSAHIGLRLKRQEDLRTTNKQSDLTRINQEFMKIFKAMADRHGLVIRKSN